MNVLQNLPASLRSGWILHAIIFVIAFDLIFVWQKLAGAQASESSGQSAESAQVVNALALHDYFASGLKGLAQEFSERYSAAYSVKSPSNTARTFAHAQGAWMLLAGPSRKALLLLNCVLLAAIVVSAFDLARTFPDRSGAVLGFAVFLAHPMMHEAVCSLDARYIVPLLIFVLLVQFCRLLVRWRSAHPSSAVAAGRLRVGKPSRRVSIFLGVIILALMILLPRKNCVWSGFRPVVQNIVEDLSRPNARILVSSDSLGEGIFTSELALADQRPARRVTLGSAVGSEVKQSAETLAKFLQDGRFDFIVFDDSVTYQTRGGVHDLLKHLLDDSGGLAWEIAAAPMVRAGLPQEAPVRLFRVKSGTFQP